MTRDQISAPLIVSIRYETDDLWCVASARKFLRACGYSGRPVEEVALVVSELVRNVLKYAGTGRLEISLIEEPRPGIRIVVDDDGPGIEDVERALHDGISQGRDVTGAGFDLRRRGMGAGLGAVQRSVDSLSIDRNTRSGTRITALKFPGSRE